MPSKVPIIFGTMTFGVNGKNGVRTDNLQDCQHLLDIFFASGNKELDTARGYGEGTTEEYLSKLKLGDATVDTKVYPGKPGDHNPTNLRRIFVTGSLSILAPHKVRVLYLHAPDRSVPYEETCAEMDRLHKEGRYDIFGLSNYTAWEVAEIVGICDRFGYVRPRIYQAMYNGITRAIEPELVPCLRRFGIRLVIYNPLAGGFFAGKVASPDGEVEKGSRFDPSTAQGKNYRDRYFKPAYFEVLEKIKTVANKHGLKMTEIALRWCQHHSVLTPEDGVIIGASSAQQLQENLQDSAKGPLPQEVLDSLDEAWSVIGGTCPPYFR